MKLTKLDLAARTAIQVCMKVKKKERILVLTDINKYEIGYALHKNARELGYYSLFVEMPVLKFNGEEPPAEIAELMKHFNVVFIPTSTSLTHTNARRTASAGGTRVATFPGITSEVMIRGMNADYNKIAKLSNQLKALLEKKNEVRITTKLGTELTFSIAGRTAFSSKGLFHKPGESGNLPTGETFLAPVEGTANGVLVVDGSMASIGVVDKEPIHIEIKNGFAVSVSGGEKAQKFKELLAKFGKPAHNVAEFGIGTNDSAKISGVLLEDEKVLGTIHIAFGNNVSMGGTSNVPLHLDGVVKKPTVYLDGKLFMDNGKLLV